MMGLGVGDGQVEARGGAAAESRVGVGQRLAAEVTGTFFLTLVGAGADVISELHPGAVSPAARAVAPALVVAAMIYALGEVSGAHFNPAVTVAFAARGVFAWRHVPGYLAAELSGALLSAGVLHFLFHPTAHEGVNHPSGGVAQSFWLEVLLTLLLVSVILNVATQHRLIGANAALPTGAAIAAAGLVGLSISGASMNPARSLGTAIVAWRWTDQWLYAAGPLVGALAAVVLTALLHGPPDLDEHHAAEGDQHR